jgi:hypothetical protein
MKRLFPRRLTELTERPNWDRVRRVFACSVTSPKEPEIVLENPRKPSPR